MVRKGWIIVSQLFINQGSCSYIKKTKKRRKHNVYGAFGRGRRFRTLGTRFWRPLLYQLSYTPKYNGPSGTRTLDRPVMSRLL